MWFACCVRYGVPASRRRTDELLSGLRVGGYRPRAWLWFIGRSAWLSWQATAARPRAAVEVCAVHAIMWHLAARRGHGVCRGRGHLPRPGHGSGHDEGARPGEGRSGRGRWWLAVSWVLAITHLGLLGQRRSLGPANVLTLVRGSLPAITPERWSASVAVATDLLDGRLARARGEMTGFGAYADALADAAFWTWFAARHEPSRALRAAALAAWAGPVAAVTGASFGRGRMVDMPRPALVRPAVALAAVLTARAFRASRPRGSRRWCARRAAGTPSACRGCSTGRTDPPDGAALAWRVGWHASG